MLDRDSVGGAIVRKQIVNTKSEKVLKPGTKLTRDEVLAMRNWRTLAAGEFPSLELFAKDPTPPAETKQTFGHMIVKQANGYLVVAKVHESVLSQGEADKLLAKMSAKN